MNIRVPIPFYNLSCAQIMSLFPRTIVCFNILIVLITFTDCDSIVSVGKRINH